MSNVVASLDAAAPVPESWPLPMPLPDTLPPVQPFTPDLLPESLRGWVTDIAHRMQCPPDFPAAGAIVAASSLIGARAVVQPKAKDDWRVAPNLWGLVVGNPGVKKSPALAGVLKPLDRLQAEESEHHQAEREAWEVDCKISKMRADADEKQAATLVKNGDHAAARALLAQKDDVAEPVARRFIVNDATAAKLGELLTVNPWGMLAYRDELVGLLGGMNRQGEEGARAFYLQAFDGNQGYTFDRIERGTKHIPRVCLAMLGGTQPGKLQEYVRSAVSGGAGDDGLLQRFALTVWPDVSREVAYVDSWPDAGAKERAWAVFERLAHLQPEGDTEPQVWRFDADAQDVFAEWLVRLDTDLVSDELHSALVSHLAKYRKLVPALALVFALVDTPEAGVIGEPELRRAIAWGQYLRTYAERMYSAATTPETGGAAALLRKIKAGALGEVFTSREVVKKGWAWLTNPGDVRKAAGVLVEYDWLRLETVPAGASGGRPSERYTVNPAALSGETEPPGQPEKLGSTQATTRQNRQNPPFAGFAGAMPGHSQKNEGGFAGFAGIPDGPIREIECSQAPAPATPGAQASTANLDLFDGDGEVFL